MNTLQLNRLMKSDPAVCRVFRGVYALDEEINPPFTYPSCYIFNTDKGSGPGEHWLALYVEDEERADYFDSFGTHPFGKLYDFAKGCSKHVYYNTKWLQGPMTSACGPYSVYFLHFRCRGFSFDTILSHFDNYDWRKNDALVYAVVEALSEG